MRTIEPDSSWAAADIDSMRLAASDAACAAAEALLTLMAARKKPGLTVQWMPDATGRGCRFEVISAKTGNYLAIATVDENGRVALMGAEELAHA